jgi:GT2 family glycosyltransferase
MNTKPPPRDHVPGVYVIILHWKRPYETVGCLQALLSNGYPDLHTLVVDNHSNDGLAEWLSLYFPQTVLLEAQANLGYAGGNNVGLKYALERGADYVLLLNDDVRLLPGALPAMVHEAETYSQVAAVAPKVRVAEQPTKIWAAGPCFGRGPFPEDRGQFDHSIQVPYAVGCCLLLNSRALSKIGLLDESYFLVHEEKEWCYRARNRGWQVRYTPEALADHRLGESFTSAWSPAYHYYFARNGLRLEEQFRQPLSPAQRLLRSVCFGMAELRFIVSHGGHKAPRAVGLGRGLLDYLRRRSGPLD